MSIRTDLAIELNRENIKGIESKEMNIGEVKVTEITVNTSEAAEELSKPQGKYITVEFPSVEKIADFSDLKKAIKNSLEAVLPKNRQKILIVGLGNTEITADAIGPQTAGRILATRHITGQFAKSIGLSGLKSVSVITPGVLGRTGIEATELVRGAVELIKPDAVIVIDALAGGSISRLFKTVQLSNTGITPGSGVKNSRKELSEKTLGVPVIAVGVPTVVDALNLAFELTGSQSGCDTDMIVTPKDADILSHRVSEILADALNVFLQPEIDEEIILSLV